MKIVRNTYRTTTSYDKLVVGELFSFNGTVYLKSRIVTGPSQGAVVAVRLEDGTACNTFLPSDVVNRISGAFVEDY